MMKTRTLGEVCDEVGGTIRTGPFGSQLHKHDYITEGVPVVMPKDIIGGKVSVESVAQIGQADVERLSQHKLHDGDIVYGRRGDIGRQALIGTAESGWLCGTGCLRISLGKSVLDPLFLHYYLDQPRLIAWVTNQATGATMPNLNTGILRKIPIIYPALPTQRKIAAVLSAYDDLIENNVRRIAILEEMAAALYREWFVELRFPKHENVPIAESEQGRVPQGWEMRQLSDLASDERRAANPTQIDADTPYIGLEHIPRKSIALGEWGRAADVSSAKLFFNEGEILFGKIRPYFHKVAVAPVNGVCSTDAIVIVPRSTELFGLVLCCASSDEFVAHAVQTSQGTKMPRANWGVMSRFPVVVPPEPLLQRFNEAVGAMVEQIQKLTFANRTLRATRDLLLPKLISGEVDVAQLAIAGAEDDDANGDQTAD